MENNQEQRLRREKRKKILLVIFLVVVGIFVILGMVALTLSGINGYLRQRAKENLEQELKTPSYVFESPNYDEDIFQDHAYMQTDRQVYYRNAELRTSITEENYASQPAATKFMYDIVQLIINGKYEEYNAIFIEEYIKNAGDELRETFTMQKLHNIEIEILLSWELDGVTYTDFKLGYMIKNNNGTFRNDIPEGAARPVVYRVMTIYDSSNDIYTSYVYALLLYSQYTSGLYD